jgi:hypothetical protein
MFLIRFYYYKACDWSIGFLQVLNISKLYHMLVSNHSMFLRAKFFSIVSVQIFSIKNANPYFYVNYVENNYFPLLSMFEMNIYIDASSSRNRLELWIELLDILPKTVAGFWLVIGILLSIKKTSQIIVGTYLWCGMASRQTTQRDT